MRYVALLRGINVTGNNMIKMADLKAVFESLGLENVATYINSGNVAFNTRKASEASLVKKIEAAIATKFRKAIPVIVRTQDDIKRILAADPFAGEYESHKQMHVLFMAGPMPADKAELLLARQTKNEKFVIRGNEIYALLLDGVAESMLGSGYIEKKLQTMYTGRNWRTVNKLLEM